MLTHLLQMVRRAVENVWYQQRRCDRIALELHCSYCTIRCCFVGSRRNSIWLWWCVLLDRVLRWSVDSCEVRRGLVRRLIGRNVVEDVVCLLLFPLLLFDLFPLLFGLDRAHQRCGKLDFASQLRRARPGSLNSQLISCNVARIVGVPFDPFEFGLRLACFSLAYPRYNGLHKVSVLYVLPDRVLPAILQPFW